MSRYRVRAMIDNRTWGILDMDTWGWCSLPGEDADGNPVVIPLEWTTPEGAEAWLQHCYRAWGSGRVRAPARWRPLPPGGLSPWVVRDQPPALPASTWDAWR